MLESYLHLCAPAPPASCRLMHYEPELAWPEVLSDLDSGHEIWPQIHYDATEPTVVTFAFMVCGDALDKARFLLLQQQNYCEDVI